jgi:hypothetical protein
MDGLGAVGANLTLPQGNAQEKLMETHKNAVS